jgi:hypothetical protein
MKMTKPTHWAARNLIATAFLAAGIVAADAAALQAQLTLRPLTPSEIKDYSLTNAQVASGLNNVGLGQPGYLELLINIAVPASDIQSVTWTLTNRPVGSAATIVTSPLGTTLPPYKMSDRLVTRVGGRAMLRPDVAGQYTVIATIVTGTSGTTNVTRTITGATYMGASTCALCHSGGIIADNVYESWSQTPHATAFTEAINGVSTDHFGKNCISCHVVGYDANSAAVNGGFDDVAAQLGWTFPTTISSTNWSAMPSALKALANVQCENCHGPGSQHAFGLGDTSKITVSYAVGTCTQCHDSKSHHVKGAEWNNSVHAITVTSPSGAGREACVGCHTGIGFAQRGAASTNTTYEAIGCAGCHDPHDASKPAQLRVNDTVTLIAGVTLTNAGTSATCMSCHMARSKASTYVDTAAASSRFGPHHGPQADMFLGVNGYTYGKTIPSSAHRDAITNACVTCHMQATASTDPTFLLAGGHTFSMTATVNGTEMDMVGACAKCHGPISTFDFPRQDYDGDGVVNGIQTEVQGLLNQLGLLLPPVGVAKSSLNITTNWTRQQLRAAWNYQMVLEDRSMGVHNLAYTVGLLKASIADLTGDGNNDGLPDTWQVKYFGSTTDPKAAPNYSAAGDGIPNWLKYALGLDPTVKGIEVPGGMVWANGTTLVNSATDTVQIFTAAEIAFNTEVGKTYQIQAISSVGAGWVNVGDPITGTGTAFSYLTPARSNVQQFYRVLIQ